ncbi:conserved hypothetical protein [delta proteobacterium NaphS2]|nr:conserved hypothetical protein [delta proteobacterium NaphS2]
MSGDITDLVETRKAFERVKILRKAVQDLGQKSERLQEEQIRERLSEIQTLGTVRNFRPLTDGDTRISGILTEEPPEPEAILNYNGQPILTRGVVGGLVAAGGTGKSFFLLQLAYALAGGTGLGPFKAAGVFTVLVLLGEDPDEEKNRRLWHIGHGDFPIGLHVYSTMGRVGPLMQLRDGNPEKAPGWYWLRDTIRFHENLNVLILDPRSRFYGLDENSNDHATAWISCLESLADEFGITIIFSHHTSKQRSDSMTQHMSRGASATVDGCRWVAGMTRLSDESARRYGISNPRGYIEFDITKSNYSAQLPAKFIFRRAENGLLEYAALEADRRQGIKKVLYEEIIRVSGEFSRRDLIRKDNGCDEILENIETEFPTFRRSNEMSSFIDELIENELLEEKTGQSDGRGKPKKLLYAVPFDPMNIRQAGLWKTSD